MLLVLKYLVKRFRGNDQFPAIFDDGRFQQPLFAAMISVIMSGDISAGISATEHFAQALTRSKVFIMTPPL